MNQFDDLNKAQREAVRTNDGPVLIVAGPGTGKTKTLTSRIVYLIESGKARPGQILALTFTKKAAEEMRQRVSKLVGKAAKPHISTFHALCFELLSGVNKEPIKFVSEAERLGIIKSLSRPAALKSLSAREIGLRISAYKNAPSSEDKYIQKLTAAYNAALQEKQLHDFDDLLLQARDLLKKDEREQKTVQSRYKYILVDEFQDTNLLQYELLKLLLGHDNLFVIGDPNQSIYGFRGASGGIFEQFEKDFVNVQKITLHVNYRSVPEVVNLSNAIFKGQQPLKAYASKIGRVQAVQVLNEYSEVNWILNEIQRAIGGGDFLKAVSDDDRTKHRTLKDFAVLYRSRSCASVLQKVIAESGLPYQVVGDGSPYEQPAVQEVISLLRSQATGEDVVLRNATKSQTHSLLAGIDKTLPPSKIVDAIVERFGFELSKELMQLSNTLVRFDDLQTAVQYLDEIAEQHFYDPNADAITLLTIHAAKGLEFAQVFLIGAEEGILPHAKADLDEEHRLFYVAATRARERLDILYVKTRSGKPATPSQFIINLSDEVLSKTTDENLQADQRRAVKRKLKRSQQSLF